MSAWGDYFGRRSPRTIFLAGLLLIAAIWRIDRLTSAQVSMSILYLVPIGFVAWFAGPPWSYAAAFISAAAWLQADILTLRAHKHWLVPYWNAVVRLGFFMIVTALAGLMQRLRRLNDVEREASRLKTEMVSLVSHEFGNSLTTMRLALTLLRESADEAEREENFAVMERVVAHLAATTANFLNLNRLEGGRFEPQFKRTPLRSAVREALSLLEPVIESKKVALLLDFPPAGVPVRVDPEALSVVMTNLIGNAFKYTPDGGTVTIRIAVENGSALIAVEDTGIGIGPEDRERILSGSYRSREARRVAKGYGVGLRVVSALLSSQGSRLGVESEPGKGSRFFFRLPLWETPARPNDPTAG